MRGVARRAGGASVRRVLLLAALLPVLGAVLGPAVGWAQAKPAGAAMGTVLGTVKDVNGNVVPTATVTLANAARTYTASASANGFFSVTVMPGRYEATVRAPDFAPWTGAVTVGAGEYHEIAGIKLAVKTVVSTVRARVMTERELATEQVKQEEKQRILGAIPNFYVSYLPNAAPMWTAQKYRLAWRYTIDPVNIILSGIAAGLEQAENTYPGYGQGMQGYGKRFGAALADDATSNFIGGAVLPSLLHQDPRFYYRGGSVRSRIWYSVETVFICKGDNGKWQPNYSFIGGNFASGAISNLYYPEGDRGVETTVNTALINTAMGVVGSLAQEFLLKRFTKK